MYIPFDLQEVNGYEKILLILDTIKEYVDATVSGKPRFGVKPVAQKIQRMGYDVDGWAVSRFVNNAKLIEGRKVFEREESGHAKYGCDITDFKRYYDETKISYMLPLFMASIER
ncbi:MAG: hypothetical protein OEZ44_06935 [Candidatus Bathyarchaeota archaeon]|jgi:hypothetical protein|nr:hypothetical protein [Candidatus Bathyarchaeota archaeon]